jgi:hypothetical protein
MERISELMTRLLPQILHAVLNFVLCLAEKECRSKRKKLRLDWAGGLAKFKEKYTSVQLQKEFFN